MGKWRKTVAMPAPARRATSSVDADSPPRPKTSKVECRGAVADTGEPFALPGVFVLRERNGEIVSSRDYFDHLTAARIRGGPDGLVAAVAAAGRR